MRGIIQILYAPAAITVADDCTLGRASNLQPAHACALLLAGPVLLRTAPAIDCLPVCVYALVLAAGLLLLLLH